MIPQNRILVSRDEVKAERGLILLPSNYITTHTGTVVESKIRDIPVGSHVCLKEETPTIELRGGEYFSATAKDILLVKKNIDPHDDMGLSSLLHK